MVYKPGMKQSKGGFGGPSGVGKVLTKSGVKKVKIILGDDEYFISEYPPYLTSGEWNVRLNENKDKVLSAYPANGMVKVQVSSFPAREGEEPAPKTKVVQGNNEYSYQYFVVMLKVVFPEKYVGCELPLMLRYHFDEIVETIKGKEQSVVGYSHPKSKYTPLLTDFCDATGVWDKGPMPYKANILPMLAKRISQADKTFAVVLKDGWVNTIFTSMDDSDSDEIGETDESWEGAGSGPQDFTPVVEKEDDDEIPY